jgi:hypothetical protein
MIDVGNGKLEMKRRIIRCTLKELIQTLQDVVIGAVSEDRARWSQEHPDAHHPSDLRRSRHRACKER